MPNNYPQNPYTLLFDRLWTMAEANDILVSLVRPGNRIKYNLNEHDPEKENIQHADVPELQLMTAGIMMNPNDSSNSVAVTTRWQWLISSGSYRFSYHFAQVKWALDCVMTKWCEVNGLTELLWEGNRFVKRFVSVSSTIGLSVDEQNRSIKGWTNVDTFEILLSLSKSSMQNFGSLDFLETQDPLDIETQDGDKMQAQT